MTGYVLGITFSRYSLLFKSPLPPPLDGTVKGSSCFFKEETKKWKKDATNIEEDSN